jgi:general secretion pathway protein K
VLLLVLVTLVVLTVMVGTIASRIESSREQVQYIRDRGEALTQLFEADQALRFRLGSIPLTSQYGVMRVDGRAYLSATGTRIELQDAAGLIDINVASSFLLSRYLASHGVEESEAEKLMQTLADYKDSDDVRSPLGAEAPEYAAAQLPPPANTRLRAPQELHNVLGWRQWLQRRPELLSGLTVNRGNGLNPATADRHVLSALGMSQQDTDRVLAERVQLGETSRIVLDSAVAHTGASLFLVTNTPPGLLRVRHQAKALPWAVEYNLRLTPTGAVTPWQVDYYVRRAIVRSESLDQLPALPPLPDASQIQSTPLFTVF